MRRLVLALMVVMMAGGPVRAGPSCEVSADLVRHDQDLPRLRAALAAHRPLAVVVVGSGSALGRGLPNPAQAWTALLGGDLAAALPGSRPVVTNLAAPGTTAPMALAGAIIRAEARRPQLVVWEVGNTDAVQEVPLDEFADAVTEGIQRMVAAGSEVILVNMQYSPETAALIDFDPYRAAIDQIARTENVDLFDRWAIMHQYVDSGRFDPSADPGGRQAVYVNACLARLLAGMIADAVNPAAATGR